MSTQESLLVIGPQACDTAVAAGPGSPVLVGPAQFSTGGSVLDEMVLSSSASGDVVHLMRDRADGALAVNYSGISPHINDGNAVLTARIDLDTAAAILQVDPGDFEPVVQAAGQALGAARARIDQWRADDPSPVLSYSQVKAVAADRWTAPGPTDAAAPGAPGLAAIERAAPILADAQGTKQPSGARVVGDPQQAGRTPKDSQTRADDDSAVAISADTSDQLAALSQLRRGGVTVSDPVVGELGQRPRCTLNGSEGQIELQVQGDTGKARLYRVTDGQSQYNPADPAGSQVGPDTAAREIGVAGYDLGYAVRHSGPTLHQAHLASDAGRGDAAWIAATTSTDHELFAVGRSTPTVGHAQISVGQPVLHAGAGDPSATVTGPAGEVDICGWTARRAHRAFTWSRPGSPSTGPRTRSTPSSG